MSNEELEDDVVLAKFINYMQKALYHMRLWIVNTFLYNFYKV